MWTINAMQTAAMVAVYLAVGWATWVYVREKAITDSHQMWQVWLMMFIAILLWLPLLVVLIVKGRR